MLIYSTQIFVILRAFFVFLRVIIICPVYPVNPVIPSNSKNRCHGGRLHTYPEFHSVFSEPRQA